MFVSNQKVFTIKSCTQRSGAFNWTKRPGDAHFLLFLAHTEQVSINGQRNELISLPFIKSSCSKIVDIRIGLRLDVHRSLLSGNDIGHNWTKELNE